MGEKPYHGEHELEFVPTGNNDDTYEVKQGRQTVGRVWRCPRPTSAACNDTRVGACGGWHGHAELMLPTTRLICSVTGMPTRIAAGRAVRAFHKAIPYTRPQPVDDTGAAAFPTTGLNLRAS